MSDKKNGAVVLSFDMDQRLPHQEYCRPGGAWLCLVSLAKRRFARVEVGGEVGADGGDEALARYPRPLEHVAGLSRDKKERKEYTQTETRKTRTETQRKGLGLLAQSQKNSFDHVFVLVVAAAAVTIAHTRAAIVERYIL